LRQEPRDAEYEAQTLRAARQLAALAVAEANQMVELNAMTLVAMLSATDPLVEELVPQARGLADEQIDKARRLLIRAVRENLGDIDAVPRGAGVTRWELPLGEVGLAAPKDRPIPDDMAQALGEIIQLRHAIIDRAARVDAKALKHAPSLPYADGDLIRIDRACYKRYSAALWTYGEEILHRMGFGPSRLHDWAMNDAINA
jgi:hypothetical protein